MTLDRIRLLGVHDFKHVNESDHEKLLRAPVYYYDYNRRLCGDLCSIDQVPYNIGVAYSFTLQPITSYNICAQTRSERLGLKWNVRDHRSVKIRTYAVFAIYSFLHACSGYLLLTSLLTESW